MKEDKWQMLLGFLGAMPESLAVRLAQAVELDRLAEGSSLPHETILDGLRPVLRRGGMRRRTPTPLRMFCEPFEDLLTAAPRSAKMRGRIANSSIYPMWNWLSQTLIADETADYCEDMKAAILGGRFDHAVARVKEFWPVASDAMRVALNTEHVRKQARLLLGGDIVVEDVREMAQVLGVGSAIFDLQRSFPKPMPSLNEETLRLLRAAYDRIIDADPDVAPLVAVIAMKRLERPWEALRLPLSIARQTQDTLISNTDMGLVGEILFADIEAHAVAIRTVRQPFFDADQLIKHVAYFTTLSSGLVKEVEMRRDGRWGQRLLQERAALAEVMDSFMKRAPREILAALPAKKMGTFQGGPRIPDIGRLPDAEKSERALRYARLIHGCKPFSAAASFAASLARAEEELTVVLMPYAEDLLRELRASQGERLANAKTYIALVADLTGYLLSTEEGKFLRRRARAATAATRAA